MNSPFALVSLVAVVHDPAAESILSSFNLSLEDAKELSDTTESILASGKKLSTG